jgi:hypothetical protein
MPPTAASFICLNRRLPIALVFLAACADSHGDGDAGSETDSSVEDAGVQHDASLPAASAGKSGPWGSCGPSPLSERVPSQVIELAEEALRPGGWAAEDIPGLANATNCGEATLGVPYRYGTIDPSVLSGIDTPDSFLLFFDLYRVAWYCDDQAAGHLEVRLLEGRWQVVAHGQNTGWESAVGDLQIDFAPDCTSGYVSRPDLGTWVILTDERTGVVVHKLFSGSVVEAHTKDELVEQLTERAGS